VTYEFPADVQAFIARELAGGRYTEEEVLTEAVRFLQAEREAATAAVREGLESIERGEGIPLADVDRYLRQKYGIPSDK
jgi:predicted transcriptional regulator